MTDSTKRARLRRKLGAHLYREVTEKYDKGRFPMHSNPAAMGPTREFPGVDIDAIHYDRRFCKRIPRV